MKTKFKMLLVVLAVSLSKGVSAQETAVTPKAENYDQGFKFGFGVNAGVPLGFERSGVQTNEVYKYSLGVDARLQYDLTQKMSIAFTTGFTNLFMDNSDVKDLGFIPLKAGFKAFVWEDRFYVLAEVGGGIAVTNGYTQNTYLWAPGLGYANKSFDVSLRYEDYTEYKTNQVALRLAYGFKL